jgi:hypothetical protein
MKKQKIFWVLLPVLALTLAACSPELNNGAVSEVESPQKEKDSTVAPLPAATEHDEAVCEDPFGGSIPAFRTDGWKTNFCLHSVDYESLFSGGPPRDGIPPIDSPRFESIESADEWIEELEPVILLDYEGEVRAYPLQILTWHEIVNDEVAGDPIVITYCPLCNTALVFLRPTIDGELLTFGTSGNLRYSDLVMWDRQTESWWQQFTGEAIVGDLTGTKLESLPVAIISWVDFKSKYPDAQVLSIETGFQRSYGRNPYAGYDNITSQPFAFVGDLDAQLPAMARVVGISPENGAGGAFSLDFLSENQVLNEKLGEVPVVLFWKSGTASALDSGSIANGKDIGTTGVFSAQIDDQELTFSALEDGLFLDQETGSTWDIFGDAIDGPLAGSSLVPIPHHDTFWFAWAAFVPDGDLKE